LLVKLVPKSKNGPSSCNQGTCASESPNDFIHEVFDISSNSRNIILQLEDDVGTLSL
jgi:hypothetical protein